MTTPIAMHLISALISSIVISKGFVLKFKELLIALVLLDFSQVFNEFLSVLVLDGPTISE